MQRAHSPLVAAAAVLAALLALALPAPAAARGTELVRLDLIDRDTGRILPAHAHRGRTYSPGMPGHRYAVRLSNLTGDRVLVVLSVDGVNAVTGQTASPEQSGYVLGPWQSTDIAGWRKSLGEVAQFVFSDRAASYASRTGRPDNVGVVGIAVFRERQAVAIAPPSPPAPSAPWHAREAPAAPAGDAAGARADTRSRREATESSRLGTAHGAREHAPVRHTEFARASRHPAQVSERHYDSERRLVAIGVIPPPRRIDRHPRAFPVGFVPDP